MGFIPVGRQEIEAQATYELDLVNAVPELDCDAPCPSVPSLPEPETSRALPWKGGKMVCTVFEQNNRKAMISPLVLVSALII